MPATLTRLRIAGFKSFAEPAAIDVLPGLTGIVGPNGCGKSNIVEALRWAMGETSARSLRGGEMDEVIFAGSAARPPRSIAEVVVTLEDAVGLAPAPLGHEPELEVGRRIERGAGSTYRINGREVRARDVQTIFADIGSGARSSAMVSQGRVALLVDSRPEDRRSVLEEAAGITGLHARRHEAELRLRAAETNLERVADRRADGERRHRALAEQAEAARAYRCAVEECGAAERSLLSVLLGRAGRARDDAGRGAAAARAALAEAEHALLAARAAEREAQLAAVADADEASLAAALLDRARATASAADEQARRSHEHLAASQHRLAETRRDHQAAGREAEASDAAHLALSAERHALRAARAAHPQRHGEASAATAAATEAATDEAERSAARRQADAALDAARHGLAEAERRLADLGGALERAAAEAPTPDDLAAAAARAAHAARFAQAARDALVSTERACRDHDQAGVEWAQQAALLADQQGRSGERLAAARRRGDRLAAERDDAAGQHEAALAARGEPSELAEAASTAQAARTALSDARAVLERAEQDHATDARLSQHATVRAEQAAWVARNSALALETAAQERLRLTARRDAVAAEQARLDAQQKDGTVLDDAHQAVAILAEAWDDARRTATAAEGARDRALADIEAAGAALAGLTAEQAAAEAEQDALAGLAGEDDGASLLACLPIPEALEPACAAALGDALFASTDPNAARHWRDLGPDLSASAPPAPARPLLSLLDAPPALSRVLSQTGLLDEPGQAPALQAALRPGQSLVTADGALYRWDGLVIGAGAAQGQAAERLRARRRVARCRAVLASVGERRPAGTALLADATGRRNAAIAALARARAEADRHEHALAASRSHAQVLATEADQISARLAATGFERDRLDAAIAEAANQETGARTAEAAADSAGLAEAAREARLRAERSLAAERDAKHALAASQAHLAVSETALRDYSARHTQSAALLAALAPVLARSNHELAEARGELEAALVENGRVQAAHAEAADRWAALAASHAQAERALDADRRTHADATAELDRATIAHAERQAASREAAIRLDALQPQTDDARLEASRAAARLDLATAARDELGPDGALAVAVVARADSQRHLAELEARDAADRSRLATLATAIPDAERRRTDAFDRAAELRARLDDSLGHHDALVGGAPGLAHASRRAADALQAALASHAVAAERAANRQAALSASGDESRAAENALGVAGQAATRAELLAEAATQAAVDIETRAHAVHPGLVAAPDATATAEADGRRRVATALATRDGFGPVNLLAEREAAELGDRLAELAAEADELTEAVGRLRGSIGYLNREGRERLSASFVAIDNQFRSLFGRMFDGGRAHLALVGSDDPLQAGLEIYAQPPGKKLATLSLLSGGEQALTALSLIFAAFRCNPAPVCVLDEVDAPLDDSNVERFCRLVSDMARETGTRFLVVTHHLLTMANMDRLYGVTMQERGVSKLLSVDLGAAEALVG